MEATENQKVSIQDAKLAVEIFKKALEYRPFIKEAIAGEAFTSLAIHERFVETITPRIGLTYADKAKTIPMLFFRFVGDGSPVLEAFFYLYEAVLSFLANTRAYARWVKPEGNAEGINKIALRNQ